MSTTNPKTVQIKFRVTPEDEEQISKNAKVCGMPLSDYLRHVSLDMCVYQCDMTCIEQHAQEIRELKDSISAFTFACFQRGCCTPSELEYVRQKTDAIQQSVDKCQKAIYRNNDKLRKRLSAEVRDIIDQHIAAADEQKMRRHAKSSITGKNAE